MRCDRSLPALLCSRLCQAQERCWRPGAIERVLSVRREAASRARGRDELLASGLCWEFRCPRWNGDCCGGPLCWRLGVDSAECVAECWDLKAVYRAYFGWGEKKYKIQVEKLASVFCVTLQLSSLCIPGAVGRNYAVAYKFTEQVTQMQCVSLHVAVGAFQLTWPYI